MSTHPKIQLNSYQKKVTMINFSVIPVIKIVSNWNFFLILSGKNLLRKNP